MTPETTYWRQLGILHPNDLRDVQVTLIGAGGIGSPTALCLAKMGLPSLTVYDNDVIEEHNLPNQMYPLESLDVGKVGALQDMVFDFTGMMPRGRSEKYESQPLSGIVISGVDSMSARQTIWQGVKDNKYTVDLYIEARMGAEMGMVYTINPKDPEQSEWYESHMLYEDLEAMELPCTERIIIYNVFILAGLICRQVKNYIKGGFLPKEIAMDLVTLTIMRSEP